MRKFRNLTMEICKKFENLKISDVELDMIVSQIQEKCDDKNFEKWEDEKKYFKHLLISELESFDVLKNFENSDNFDNIYELNETDQLEDKTDEDKTDEDKTDELEFETDEYEKINDELAYKKETVVDIYMKDLIGTAELLTEEEFLILFDKYKNSTGDQKIKYRNILVERNLRLVIFIAKSRSNGNVDFIDLVQEGNIGLVKAVENFDLKFNAKFSTYAAIWIKSFINRCNSDTSFNIRIPINRAAKIRKIKSIINNYKQLTGVNPTSDYIAPLVNSTPLEVDMLISGKLLSSGSTVSLNLLIGNESDDQLMDFIADSSPSIDNVYFKTELVENVNKLLAECSLTEREINMIKYRYGFINNKTYSLEEIGGMYNLTRERTRQIINQALKKLSLDKNIGNLSAFLDNPDVCNKNLNSSRLSSKKVNKTVIQDFSKEDPSVVLFVVNYLLLINKSTITAKYGRDLNVPFSSFDPNLPYSKILSKDVKNLIRKNIDEYKKNPDKFLKNPIYLMSIAPSMPTVYEECAGVDVSIVNNVISSMHSSYNTFIVERYGLDFFNPMPVPENFSKSFYDKSQYLLTEIKRRIKFCEMNPDVYRAGDYYTKFSLYPKVSIDMVYDKLLNYTGSNKDVLFHLSLEYFNCQNLPDDLLILHVNEFMLGSKAHFELQYSDIAIIFGVCVEKIIFLSKVVFDNFKKDSNTKKIKM